MLLMLPFVIKIFVLSIFSDRFTQVLLYYLQTMTIANRRIVTGDCLFTFLQMNRSRINEYVARRCGIKGDFNQSPGLIISQTL